MIAFGWGYLAYRHWALNGVDTIRQGRVLFLGVLSGLLIPAAPAALSPVFYPVIVAGDFLGWKFSFRTVKWRCSGCFTEGYRYSEIGGKLFLSLATVKTHVHHICRKPGISRREELFLKVRKLQSEKVRDGLS